MRGISLIPATWLKLVHGMTGLRSWFDFWKMPEFSVRAGIQDPGENKTHLEEAFQWVEDEIEEMISDGILCQRYRGTQWCCPSFLITQLYSMTHKKHCSYTY